MGNFLQIIFESLTGTAGVLIYNLLLAFSFASALQGSLVHWRGPYKAQANRQATGLFVLLIFQLALFTATGLGWTGAVNLSQVLPVTDRVLVAFSLLWIIWLWAFPEPLRWVDVLTFMLAIVCIIAGLFSLSFWSAPDSTTPFNGSWLDQSWCIFALVLVLIGAAVLLIKHPDRWGTGLYIMAAMGVGLLLQLLLPPANGDYAPSVRLAQAITYPLLIILPQRFNPLTAQITPTKEAQSEPEKRHYTTDLQTINTLLELAAENDPARLRLAIMRAICQTMVADLSLLVTAPTVDGILNIEGGYDLIRDETLPYHDLPPNALPLLANALLKGRGVRLPYNHATSPDIKNLSEALGLANPGNLLAAPLGIRGQNPMGGILLLSPYSTRVWTSDDQAYLARIAETMASLLLRISKAAEMQSVNEQEHLELQTLRQQLIALRQQTPPPSTQDITALVALQKETQAELERLQAENETLLNGSPSAPQNNPESTQLENELRLTLKEMAHLQNSLASANIRIMELEKQLAGNPENSKRVDTVANLIQELRQAVISLNNQVNLLAGDEKEIQSHQVENLKATAERLRAMVGSLEIQPVDSSESQTGDV